MAAQASRIKPFRGRFSVVRKDTRGIAIEAMASFLAVPVRIRAVAESAKVHSVRALTADASGTSGALQFTLVESGQDTRVRLVLPRLEIATILLIE